MTDRKLSAASVSASANGTSQRWGLDERSGRFSVWAPSAGAMALARPEDADLPLVQDEQGWHSVASSGLRPGDRYGLRVGGRVVPDPASRSQPDGPGGWSAVMDSGRFAWSDAAWRGRPWAETVLYELHIGTFTPEGTFLAAIGRLEHLARLGVTTVELMPVGDFDGRRNWGYDGVLPYAPYRGYGEPDDLKRLVDACHARGIAVALDVVYNHFGPAHNAIAEYVPEFFTDAHETPWGAGDRFQPGSGPRILCRERRLLDHRVPSRWAAPGRGASGVRRRDAAYPGRDRGAGAGGGAGAAHSPHAGERQQRVALARSGAARLV